VGEGWYLLAGKKVRLFEWGGGWYLLAGKEVGLLE
jgi:hypothetical protein